MIESLNMWMRERRSAYVECVQVCAEEEEEEEEERGEGDAGGITRRCGK